MNKKQLTGGIKYNYTINVIKNTKTTNGRQLTGVSGISLPLVDCGVGIILGVTRCRQALQLEGASKKNATRADMATQSESCCFKPGWNEREE